MDKTPDKFQKLLTSVKDKTSLYKAFHDGFTPDDVKAGVVEILSPYFSNKSTLDKMAVNYLMPHVIEYARLSAIGVPFQAFKYSYSYIWHLKPRMKYRVLQRVLSGYQIYMMAYQFFGVKRI